MKFLADMGISPRTVGVPRALGHEAVRLPELGMDRSPDEEVIARAAREGQIVLTFDLDYPMLLAVRPAPRASAIVFRTSDADPDRVNSLLARFLPTIAPILEEGAVAVIEDDRVRIRKYSTEPGST